MPPPPSAGVAMVGALVLTYYRQGFLNYMVSPLYDCFTSFNFKADHMMHLLQNLAKNVTMYAGLGTRHGPAWARRRRACLRLWGRPRGDRHKRVPCAGTTRRCLPNCRRRGRSPKT